MNASELAAKIDHTILKPEASAAEVDKVIAEAITHRFASVCISPPFVAHTSAKLKGSGVKTCTVIGFPNGTHKATIKAIEATSTIKEGAEEIDIVAYLPHLLRLDLDAARGELIEIVRAARATRSDVIIKVIVESAALTSINKGREEETIKLACRAVIESGCDFIKTSTGFHPAGGADERVVRWMDHYGAGAIKVKASGGIRDLRTARLMVAAGADRLGMSAGVSVMNELGGQDSDAGAPGY
ncbi:MAG: deoxyribose-phosphate aldolase [Burkholderiales bacterium]|nr:deoxyribose-phosphate aldolase [Phycisphaerae bacterium]